MAREIRRFPVTVPAGTAKASPQVSNLSFPFRVVRELEIRVPPGPRGEVGFALGGSGQAVIPVEAGAYLVTDDEIIRWQLDGFWDSGSWQFTAYNTGRFPHTIEVRFLVDLPDEVEAGANLTTLVGATGQVIG